MVAIIGLAYFLASFHRLGIAVIATEVSKDLGLTIQQLGVLGSAFFYSYAAMQIPSGILTDRYGIKPVILISLVLTTVSTVLFGLTHSYHGAYAARILLGLGVSCVYIAALKAMREWFGDSKLGFLTGLLFSIGNLGALAASTPLLLASSKIGWRYVFLGIGMFCGLLAYLTQTQLVNTTAHHQTLRTNDGMKKQWPIVRSTLLEKRFLGIIFWFVVYLGTKMSFQGLWATQHMEYSLGYSSLQVGNTLAVYILGNIAGGPLAGLISDRFERERVLTAYSVAFGTTWLLLTFAAVIPYSIMLLLYTLMGMTGSGALSVGFSRVIDMSPKAVSATMLGYVNCFAFFASGMITQFTGKWIDHVQPARGIHFGFNSLFLLFLLLSVLATIAIGKPIRDKKGQEHMKPTTES